MSPTPAVWSGFLTYDEERRQSRFGAILVGLVFFGAIFVPNYVAGLGGIPPIRLEDWVIVFMVFYAFRQARLQGRQFFTGPVLVISGMWLLFVFAKTMGLVNHYTSSPETFVVNDLYTPLAFIRCMVTFIAVANLNIHADHLRKILWLLVFTLVAQCVLAIAQIAMPGRFTQVFVDLYGLSGTVRYAGGTGLLHRAIGTVGNPNVLGAIIAVFVACATTMAVFSQYLITRIVCWAVVGLGAYTAIIVAQSRTTLFSVTATVVTVLAASLLVSGRRVAPSVIVLTVLMLLAVVLGLFGQVEVPERVQMMVEEFEARGVGEGLVENLRSRVDMWLYQMGQVEQTGNYWFGNGGSELAGIAYDNGYVSIYVTSGTVGLIAFVMLYFSIAWYIGRALLRGRHSEYAPVCVALAGVWMGMNVYEITAGFFEGSMTTILVPVFQGMALAVLMSIQRDESFPVGTCESLPRHALAEVEA
jgi:O-antigen ligase